MVDAKGSLSDFDRHSLYEACAREAQRIGGDERTAEYFFVRAQSSRVWLSSQGAVTVADMDIKDWCGAIAWSAPGIGRSPKRGKRKPNNSDARNHPADEISPAITDQSNAQSPRKQARSGARFRRAIRFEPQR